MTRPMGIEGLGWLLCLQRLAQDVGKVRKLSISDYLYILKV